MSRVVPRVTIPCDFCGATLERLPRLVSKQNFCSREHRHAYMHNDVEDFWKNVDIRGPNECWPWLGAKHKRFEHGRYRWKGQERTAHSVAHEITYGPTEGVRGTTGILMRHSCDSPPCVNPAHIIPGTAKDNTADMMERKRHKPIVGEKAAKAKLTEDDVRAIRRDPRTHEEIGRSYGISNQNVSWIKARKGWKHVV
jgi:hypothetical protein